MYKYFLVRSRLFFRKLLIIMKLNMICVEVLKFDAAFSLSRSSYSGAGFDECLSV